MCHLHLCVIFVPFDGIYVKILYNLYIYYIIICNSNNVEVTRAGLAGVPNLALRPLELPYTFA